VFDVAIVGAGAAGLGAAMRASERGVSYCVLEAAGRRGGRAWTDHQVLGCPFDLGCHWLQGGPANPFRDRAASLGATLGHAVLAYVFHDGQRYLDASETEAGNAAADAYGAALRAAHRALADDPDLQDRTVADLVSGDDPWSGYFLAGMRHECAGEPRDVTLRDGTVTVSRPDDLPVLSGYGDLLMAAAQSVSVTLECPVTAIDLAARDRVVLDTPKGQIEARYALMTVSTAVLSAGRIALRPGGWPDWKRAAIDATPTGSATKVAVRLKPGMLSTLYAARTDVGALDTIIYCDTEAPGGHAPAFWHLGTGDGSLAIAYLGGDRSRDLALAGHDAQAEAAIAHLALLLGNEVRRAVTAIGTTPYDRDPLLGGGYSYCRAGLGNRRSDLAAPIEDRLLFAGEACSIEHTGTAHGAWITGQDAIDRLAAALSCGAALSA